MQPDFRPSPGMIDRNGIRLPGFQFRMAVETIVTRIKFEAINLINVLHLLQLRDKIIPCLRIRQIITGTITVPPVDHRCFSILPSQKVFLLLQFAKLRTISRNKRTNPQHHLETHCMQLFHHAFRRRETIRLKLEVPVILLPVIINHHYSTRKILFADLPCIIQHIRLVLIIHQFDPCIVLGLRKKQSIRQLTTGGKVLTASVQISIPQRTARLFHLYLFVFGINPDTLFRN